jgi:hypothetical protein
MDWQIISTVLAVLLTASVAANIKLVISNYNVNRAYDKLEILTQKQTD